MKKGYTLVELLAVIMIISIIAILALTRINDYTSKLKETSNDKFQTLIKSSAKSYFYNNKNLKQKVKNGNRTAIHYTTLKENNYLSERLINLKTYKKLNVEQSCVCVDYVDYKYVFEVEQPCSCD